MPEFLTKFFDSVKTIFEKLTLVQKLIGGGVIVAAIIGIILLTTLNSSSAGVPLFTQKIDLVEMSKITKKLDESSIKYSIKGDSIILLSSEDVKNKSLMLLAQNGLMPKGKYTLSDIINSKDFTSSQALMDIKKRAALEGRLEKLLESSSLIDTASVAITMPEQEVFIKDRSPVKVAVMLTGKYGTNLSSTESKSAIKGIEELVTNSIDRAEKENVTITDNYGIKLNDWIGEEQDNRTRAAKEDLKIREGQINSYRDKIQAAITKMIPADRFSIMVDVDMNFDKQKENRTEILPVVLKEDDPATPYDDSDKRYSITISSKKTNETFKGPNWIPEGPPGFDSNVPPGYKGALEQMTEYIKNEEIVNEETGKSIKDIEKDPYDINRITASVTIDGTYAFVYDNKKNHEKNPDGSRKRTYIPVPPKDLVTIKGFVEQGIGFVAGKAKVEVYELQKDRSAEFKKEDEEWIRKQNLTYALIAGLIALVILVVLTIIYRVVAKEIERRKRLKEEELARQHQLAREMALKSAEEDGVEVEMSQEDKARLEMQETAINIAREHPDEVAQLIRTWLQEE